MITRKELEELGWEIEYDTTFEKDYIFFHKKGDMFNTYNLYEDFDVTGNIRISHIGRDLRVFVGKLISTNPKQELQTIMKQIGII